MIAFLLAVAGAQSADVLIERLGSDDAAERERAGAALVELGEPARDALQRAAKGNDPEVSARARRVLAELDRAALRARVLGKPLRVDLEERERPLGELAEELRRATGVALLLPDGAAKDPVRIGAGGEPILDFLDRLGRAHGGLRVAYPQPEGRIALEAGVPSVAPTCTDGLVQVRLQALRVTRRNLFHDTVGRGYVLLEAAWPPTVRPLMTTFDGEPTWSVEEVVAEGGAALARQDLMDGTGYSSFSFGRKHRSPRGTRHVQAFELPAAGVRRLARLRGRLTLRFPQRIETVVFRDVLKAGEQTRDFGTVKVRLRGARSEGGERFADLELEGPPRLLTRDPARAVSVRGRILGPILAVGPSEAPTRNVSNRLDGRRSGEGGTVAETYWVTVAWPEAAGADVLRFDLLLEWFERVVPFEFRDVELP